MGKYSIDEATLKDVADSIRAKTEVTDEIPVTEFASRIGDITTGVELPELTKVAPVEYVLQGFEYIDRTGMKRTGTMIDRSSMASVGIQLAPGEQYTLKKGYYAVTPISVSEPDKVTLTIHNDTSYEVRVYFYDWIVEGTEWYSIDSGASDNIILMPNSIVVIRMDYNADADDVDKWFEGSDERYYYGIVSVAGSDKTITITGY
jgi:hypothetical protein